jgi:hypothetical protein
MWLNQKDLDIRCVRMKPYKLGEAVLLDIEQIIPLPEAQDYQIKVKQQAVIQKAAKNEIESTKKARYLFNGNIYGAGRLVFAVIKKTCDDNPSYNLAKLQELFPKIHSSYQTITTITEAQDIRGRTDRQHKRHYLNQEDIIKTSDGCELAVCNQWNRYGTNDFIRQIPKELGYTIEIVADNAELN